MKKSKKIIVIIGIALVLVALVGALIHAKNVNSSNVSEKVLKFYNWENGKQKEYEYKCNTNNCSSKKVEDSSLINGEYVEGNYYSLLDGKSYLYNPITNEKIEVDITNGFINQIFYNEKGEKVAFSIKDGDFAFEREYLYLIENKKTYLKGDSNENIDFMIYQYTEDDTIKYKYINMDLVVSKKIDGHFQIVDFKNNKVVFDTTKLNIKNEYDYNFAEIKPIKISDNEYYYDLYYGDGETAYILNEKFEKIVKHYPQEMGAQFDQGNQYSFINNRIYVINDDKTSFSVYDYNGKLINKSKQYKNIYCVDKGYFLVSLDKNDKFTIVNSNEKVVVKLDISRREGQTISVDNNIITVKTSNLYCDYTYKYSLDKNEFISKSDKCDNY